MNTKDLITTIRGKLGLPVDDTEKLLDASVAAIKEQLVAGNLVSIQGFGQFEPKKKNERISVNPSTGERMLVPPKISVAFKPSVSLKDLIGKEG